MRRHSAPLLLISATGARYAGQVALLAIIAQTGGPEAVGRFTLALAITAPGFVAIDLGLRDLRLTLYDAIADSRYRSLRAVTSGAVVVVTLVGVASVAPESFLLYAAVCLQKVCDQTNDLRSGFLQVRGSYAAIARLACVTTALQLAVASGARTLGFSPDQCVLASSFGYAFGLVLTGILSERRNAAAPDRHPRGSSRSGRSVLSDWRILLRAGIPTGIAFGLSTLTTAIPQYVLNVFHGPDAAGHLAVVLYIVVAVQIVGNALGQSWIPLARAMHQEERLGTREAFHASVRWLPWTTLSAVCLGAAASIAFPLVFGDLFVVSWRDLLPLTAAAVALPFMLSTGTVLAVRNQYAAVSVVTLTAAISSAVFAIAFVPGGGTTGALWACAAVMVLRAVLAASALRFRHREVRPAVTP